MVEPRVGRRRVGARRVVGARPVGLRRIVGARPVGARPVGLRRVVGARRVGLRRALAAGAAAGGAGYCWLAAGLRPFTAPMDAAVAAPVAVTALLAWRRHRRLPAPATLTWAEAAPWIGLTAMVAVVEMVGYLSSPRSEHPTLSSMADAAMGSHLGRATGIALWLGVGWILFAGRGATPRS